MKVRGNLLFAALVLTGPIGAGVLASQALAASGDPQSKNGPPAARRGASAAAAPAAAGGYVIGPDDVLEITYWRDKDMSAEAVVRPDGKISLPLLNDVEAAGLTPGQLLERVRSEARRYVENPSATVVVKQVNSRKVYVTGSIAKPGSYPLTNPTTVLQLIATAGGLTEWAQREDIVIVRTTDKRQVAFSFNYKDVTRNKNLSQNIQLEPGDTVIVP